MLALRRMHACMPACTPACAQVVLAAYPFLWWQLYSGLLRTRAKRLRSAAGSTGGKAKAE